MKLLQEDPTETTRDILLAISQQIANNSIPAYQPVEYETPKYAVVVNGLFFAALSCGLIAALLAVLALQWVANYDVGLNTTSPRKRAIQRQVRWMGIENWKMSEIIALLPLLIFISLFLFFIGIADWLWHMNRIISGIVIGGIGIGFSLYTITTLISIVAIDAPFRTPISKGLAILVIRASAWAKVIFIEFLAMVIQRYRVSSGSSWPRIRGLWMDQSDAKSVLSTSFLKQEDLIIEKRKEGPLECLLWLANRIEISSNSQSQLMTLIKELIKVPAEVLLQKDKISDAPWESIFMIMCSKYLGKSIEQWPKEEATTIVDICKAMGMIPSVLSSKALYNFVDSMGSLESPLAWTISVFVCGRHNNDWHIWNFLSFRDPKGRNIVAELDINYLHLILLSIQPAWGVLGPCRKTILEALGQICTISPQEIGNITYFPILSVSSLKVIMNLVANQDTERNLINTGNSVNKMRALTDRYTRIARQMIEEETESVGLMTHRSIQQQLLAHISCIDVVSRSAYDEAKRLLDLLCYGI
jgi:hypothetical protein